jgi:hypothetical protein
MMALAMDSILRSTTLAFSDSIKCRLPISAVEAAAMASVAEFKFQSQS